MQVVTSVRLQSCFVDLAPVTCLTTSPLYTTVLSLVEDTMEVSDIVDTGGRLFFISPRPHLEMRELQDCLGMLVVWRSSKRMCLKDASHEAAHPIEEEWKPNDANKRHNVKRSDSRIVTDTDARKKWGAQGQQRKVEARRGSKRPRSFHHMLTRRGSCQGTSWRRSGDKCTSGFGRRG